MGKASAIVNKKDLAKIRKEGAYISNALVIAPSDGEMTLIESEDGSVMIDGEGYWVTSLDHAKDVAKIHAHPGFKWDRTSYFFDLPKIGKTNTRVDDICKEFGFDVFAKNVYQDGYLILKYLNPENKFYPYVGGKLTDDGRLIVIDRNARIPEEAVGHCYCHRNGMYDDKEVCKVNVDLPSPN